MLYYSNFHFMRRLRDYSPPTSTNALCSCGLDSEEQFYAFFPILLFLLFRTRADGAAGSSSGS